MNKAAFAVHCLTHQVSTWTSLPTSCLCLIPYSLKKFFAFHANLLINQPCNILQAQELVCYVCKKSYSDRYSLRYHLRTHGIGRQIRCELCGKNFTKQSRLTAHIDSIHNNIRPFPCPHCDKAFKARLHLENHMLQVKTRRYDDRKLYIRSTPKLILPDWKTFCNLCIFSTQGKDPSRVQPVETAFGIRY